ncbi:hypothetical protein BX070DRAFT_233955 [Coemansia spiralis]|nr:hypothetical protein BX070DRAFT_233955 [Coemansia spiralis]
MNSEFSTPSRSQQHSPAPLPSQHLAASVCSDTQLPTPAVMPYPLPMGHMDIVTPTTAVDLGSAHFAYLKDAFSQRPFSPSSMDFASMNIASGYHTPHAATPVVMHSKQQQQQQQSVSTDALAVIPTSAPLPEVTTAAAASTADDDADTCTAESASAGTPSPDKPDYSYASLIAQSLIDAPMQRRTLNGIYEWIQEHFPYYRTRQNWQIVAFQYPLFRNYFMLHGARCLCHSNILSLVTLMAEWVRASGGGHKRRFLSFYPIIEIVCLSCAHLAGHAYISAPGVDEMERSRWEQQAQQQGRICSHHACGLPSLPSFASFCCSAPALPLDACCEQLRPVQQFQVKKREGWLHKISWPF